MEKETVEKRGGKVDAVANILLFFNRYVDGCVRYGISDGVKDLGDAVF